MIYILPKGSLKIEHFKEEQIILLLELVNSSNGQEWIEMLQNLKVETLNSKD